jgi:uncharacterized OB-fold protein
MAQERKEEELIRVESRLKIDFRFAAGRYLTKFYTELRDRGKLWAIRCPKCQMLRWPQIVCGPCHVKLPEFPEGWVELSGRGYLDSWMKIAIPQMDLLGRTEPDEYLHGTAWLDEGIALIHLLGVQPDSKEEGKVQRGLRVEIEMKPIEERIGVLEDIKYLKVLWDEPMKKE